MKVLVDFKVLRLLVVAVSAMLPFAALAAPLITAHYRLDPDISGAFGGLGGTPHYGLVDVGSEAALGFGSSPSYKLGSGYTAQLQHSLQLTVLPSGVTSYYSLDTGLGSQAYDTSAGGNTGSIHGTPSWVSGQIGTALTFDGSTSYISTTTQFTNPNPFSLELWFKTNTVQGGRLIGFGDAVSGASTNADRQVYMTNSGQLIFGVKPGAQQTLTSAASYNDNAWHHLAATLGASGLQFYVDGVSVGTNAGVTTAQNYAGYWRIGYDSLAGWPSAPTSNYFAGSIDEVKIYNRALNSTEVLNEYNAGSAGLVSAQTIPQITSGVSHTSLTDVTVRTDGPGYNLAVSQDHNLRHTDAVTLISPVAAAIAAPALWTEGTTTGLGFTLSAGTQIEAKWGTNPNYDYAAVPTTATTYHSHTGLLGGSSDTTTLQFRLDTPANQKSGKYSNIVTVSATVIP
jgi:hypothetical protein